MSGTTSDGWSYDDLPDGVLVADDTGSVVCLNAAGSRLLGREPEECVGRNYREILPLVDNGGNDWWSCTDPYDGLWTRTSQPERQLTLVKGPEGEGHDLLVTARYVREERRVVRLVVSFRDAAARERVDRSRADLISTVAHELRSPLTSVKGFTATLLAKWDRFGDEQKKVMLQTVNADADRVTRLLTDLLDVSRIDAGRLELRRQVVDLPDAIRRAFAGRVASGAPEGTFTLDVTGELPEMWLDPDKIAQVLGNLLENALKYGAGTISVTVHGTPAGAEVAVSDEGEGIPEEMHSRVFSKFWRRADGGRRKGTGLGLFITKGLVEVHGGHITVGRSASGGAEFRFTLPAGAPSYEV
ncbi:MAG TPA: ATP-binding protein [Mycobacteriales bacterium]|nr:ATP-binding protein [Mycobacteriales bacterium]